MPGGISALIICKDASCVKTGAEESRPRWLPHLLEATRSLVKSLDI